MIDNESVGSPTSEEDDMIIKLSKCRSKSGSKIKNKKYKRDLSEIKEVTEYCDS